MWLDNGSEYMAADGTQWTDRAGGYNVTAAGAACPTFTTNQVNGRPAFVFDGVNDIMTRLGSPAVPPIQGLSGLTMWAVGQRFGFNHYSSASLRTEILHFTDNVVYGIIANSANSSGSFTHTNNFCYVVLVFDGSQGSNSTRLTIYVNGVLRTLTFVSTIPATTEASVISDFQIGTTGTTKFAGSACEFGAVASVLSAGQITNLNSYLSSKYAI
jgi:hypothetical protein